MFGFRAEHSASVDSTSSTFSFISISYSRLNVLGGAASGFGSKMPHSSAPPHPKIDPFGKCSVGKSPHLLLGIRVVSFMTPPSSYGRSICR